MQPARIPDDESQRLAALRETGALDSDADRTLDELTTLAAQICEAPIALISLVDEDRQWFQSRVGLAATQTSRDVAFCAHAILGEDLMVVPDAAADERFHDNPLVVTSPGVRFYAGSPLRTHDGLALGTLCVIDTVPRRLAPHQEEALRALARHASSRLEVRRLLGRLRGTLQGGELDARAKAVLERSIRPLTVALERAVDERDRAEQAVRDLESCFRRVETFERIGRLAGGLAHDVNNLLTVVLGHTELLLGRSDPSPDQRESMRAIREAAGLASDLVARVLSLGRQQEPQPRPLELDPVVRRTTELLRLFVPRALELSFEPGAEGAWVEADPVQIEQVIVNLAMNAADAMPAGGTLRLATSLRRPDGAPSSAVLTISDTGVGMDEQTLAQALEPFFTTKSTGTGLGLPNVREIVRYLGGDLTLDSRPGEGTRVEIRLPCTGPG